MSECEDLDVNNYVWIKNQGGGDCLLIAVLTFLDLERGIYRNIEPNSERVNDLRKELVDILRRDYDSNETIKIAMDTYIYDKQERCRTFIKASNDLETLIFMTNGTIPPDESSRIDILKFLSEIINVDDFDFTDLSTLTYIKKYIDKYKDELKCFDIALTRLARQGEWLGNESVVAISILYNRPICIFNPPTNKFSFGGSINAIAESNVITLIHVDRNHYEVLINKDKLQFVNRDVKIKSDSKPESCSSNCKVYTLLNQEIPLHKIGNIYKIIDMNMQTRLIELNSKAIDDITITEMMSLDEDVSKAIKTNQEITDLQAQIEINTARKLEMDEILQNDKAKPIFDTGSGTTKTMVKPVKSVKSATINLPDFKPVMPQVKTLSDLALQTRLSELSSEDKNEENTIKMLLFIGKHLTDEKLVGKGVPMSERWNKLEIGLGLEDTNIEKPKYISILNNMLIIGKSAKMIIID